MAIPKAQIETWSKQPSPGRSAEAYASVQKAIEGIPAPYRFDTYLQGSYANATNIRADSDVDVVLQLTSSFQHNAKSLTPDEQVRFHQHYSNATHSWADFRSEVLSKLQTYYGASMVVEGAKCLKIKPNGNRLPIDVLVAQDYKYFTDFSPHPQPLSVDGLTFWTRDSRQVINFPKHHRKNGEGKHNRTNGQYKPIVRAVKNARRMAVENGLLGRDASPSYFVECFLHNVHDSNYPSDIQLAYTQVLDALNDNREQFPRLLCQNEVVQLFGPTSEQWDIDRANRLVDALIYQWRNWNA